MNGSNKKSTTGKDAPAQIVEKLMQRTAIGVFLMAIAYAMSAAMYLVSNEMADHIDNLQLVLGFLVLLIVFPAFWKFSRLKFRQRNACLEADGYIVAMFKRASARAFSLTFIFLIALELITEKYFTDLPAPFFINVILALTLGVFSITFFQLIRSDGDDESDDEFDTEPAP